MELSKYTPENSSLLSGEELLTLIAGDRLKIETNLAGGGGTEILNVVVPMGKRWDIRIEVAGDEDGS